MVSHDILLNESDRTVALVIAYVPFSLGAEILARFTLDRQTEIIRQIESIDEVARFALKHGTESFW